MQWDARRTPASRDAEPWLPLADDFAEHNVAAERDDPASMLTLYRRLIELRRAEPALIVGHVRRASPAEGDVLAYIREHDGSRSSIALNLGRMASLAVESPASGTVVLERTLTAKARTIEGRVELRGR